MHKQKDLLKLAGFTIIELLIVIVIIAILAAITLVAYNGIEEKANNTKTINVVETYVKLLTMYRTDNSDFPAVTSCLGVGYDSATCRGDGGGFVENGGSLNSAYLRPYTSGSVPSPSTIRYPYSGVGWIAGAYYRYPSDSMYNPAGGPGIGVMLAGSSCPSISGLALASSSVSGSAILCRYGLN